MHAYSDDDCGWRCSRVRVLGQAGILGGAHIEWTDVRTFERVMDVNHTGGIRVTKAFMPLLVRAHAPHELHPCHLILVPVFLLPRALS